MYQILNQAPEIYRYQFTYTRLLHGDTINYIHGIHRHFVVRNNDELGILTELLDHLCKFSHVHIIQWCIHFIQDAEWSGLDKINGK